VGEVKLEVAVSLQAGNDQVQPLLTLHGIEMSLADGICSKP